jgi:hypothetical protein
MQINELHHQRPLGGRGVGRIDVAPQWVQSLRRRNRDLHGIEVVKVWMYAADAESIAAGEAARVVTDKNLPLAVFNVDGQFFCTADTCTHEASSLSEGYRYFRSRLSP